MLHNLNIRVLYRFVEHGLIVHQRGDTIEWQARKSVGLEEEQSKASTRGAAVQTEKKEEIEMERYASETDSEHGKMIQDVPPKYVHKKHFALK